MEKLELVDLFRRRSNELRQRGELACVAFHQEGLEIALVYHLTEGTSCEARLSVEELATDDWSAIVDERLACSGPNR